MLDIVPQKVHFKTIVLYQLQTYDKIFISKMAISEIFLKKKKGKESGGREADM